MPLLASVDTACMCLHADKTPRHKIKPGSSLISYPDSLTVGCDLELFVDKPFSSQVAFGWGVLQQYTPSLRQRAACEQSLEYTKTYNSI